jgi:serine phosphatase RsbU (regulator of sigma subunit)
VEAKDCDRPAGAHGVAARGTRGPSSSTSAEERSLDELLRRADLAAAHDLPGLFQGHADVLGVGDPVAYLVDLQQNSLVPLIDAPAPDDARQVSTLGVDSTLAGRAFQQAQILTQTADSGHGLRLWLPLVNGTERLGVLAVTVPDAEVLESHDAALSVRLRTFAAVVAELITSKTLYGDTLVRLRRTAEMGLAAEMQWALLPPLTFVSPTVTIAGALEPAYEVAGDSIDYAVDKGLARFAIFDGMGHGLRSAQLVTLSVAAYRNGRRSDRSLDMTARTIDTAVDAAVAADAFITGVLAELNTDLGLLTWVNAGHPDPLLLRGGRLIKSLHVEPILPFGLNAELGSDGDAEAPTYANTGTEALEPGDIVVLYTDGVIEARSPLGEFFGAERLVDLLTRSLAAGLSAPETMRRIVRVLLEHHRSQLDDDATLMFVKW